MDLLTLLSCLLHHGILSHLAPQLDRDDVCWHKQLRPHADVLFVTKLLEALELALKAQIRHSAQVSNAIGPVSVCLRLDHERATPALGVPGSRFSRQQEIDPKVATVEITTHLCAHMLKSFTETHFNKMLARSFGMLHSNTVIRFFVLVSPLDSILHADTRHEDTSQ